MKKLKLLIAVLTLLFTTVSCEETDPYSYLKIKGDWILQTVNDIQIDTSARTVISFMDGNACKVALLSKNKDGSSEWIVNEGLEWNFHGTVLEISGIDNGGNVFLQNNKFLDVNDNNLRFVVNESSQQIGETASSYNCLFSRIGKDSNNYIGTWESIEYAGQSNSGIRIAIDAENNMTIYTSTDGQWVQTLSAKCFIYNNFLAVNYTKDGVKTCYTWDYDIATSGNETTWLLTAKTGDSYTSAIFKKLNE